MQAKGCSDLLVSTHFGGDGHLGDCGRSQFCQQSMKANVVVGSLESASNEGKEGRDQKKDADVCGQNWGRSLQNTRAIEGRRRALPLFHPSHYPFLLLPPSSVFFRLLLPLPRLDVLIFPAVHPAGSTPAAAPSAPSKTYRLQMAVPRHIESVFHSFRLPNIPVSRAEAF
ncbi:hypothetical protein MSAN_01391100 [Mycena sanguinolenta]|uniref:Uncharacterized protein n=1 Tax=Mycena sanguinolenta TaxID=230812 RepID=A0A8H6YAG1_9AGAR|nr:hypothetical protein MSAN_01391100 [Mycena sanguinolenta]